MPSRTGSLEITPLPATADSTDRQKNGEETPGETTDTSEGNQTGTSSSSQQKPKRFLKFRKYMLRLKGALSIEIPDTSAQLANKARNAAELARITEHSKINAELIAQRNARDAVDGLFCNCALRLMRTRSATGERVCQDSISDPEDEDEDEETEERRGCESQSVSR